MMLNTKVVTLSDIIFYILLFTQALRNREDAKNFIYEEAQFPEVKVYTATLHVKVSILLKANTPFYVSNAK